MINKLTKYKYKTKKILNNMIIINNNNNNNNKYNNKSKYNITYKHKINKIEPNKFISFHFYSSFSSFSYLKTFSYKNKMFHLFKNNTNKNIYNLLNKPNVISKLFYTTEPNKEQEKGIFIYILLLTS